MIATRIICAINSDSLAMAIHHGNSKQVYNRCATWLRLWSAIDPSSGHRLALAGTYTLIHHHWLHLCFSCASARRHAVVPGQSVAGDISSAFLRAKQWPQLCIYAAAVPFRGTQTSLGLCICNVRLKHVRRKPVDRSSSHQRAGRKNYIELSES